MMDNIKQENVDIEIKHEEVCFELIEEAGSYVTDGIKEENLLSNEMIKENGIFEQSKIMEFIHVDGEDNWTEPLKHVSDPLAFLPAVQNKVETKSTEGEHTSIIDASPSTSQGIDVLFLCAKCGSKFASYDEHHKHIESCSFTNLYINTEDKPFKCTQCDYSTTEKDYLKRHVKVHTDEKPFKCLQCNYSTIKRCNLKNHTRVHTGEKPFKCLQCDYTAAFQSSIKSHTRVHTGEKPYKCAECDYSTVKPCFLKIHSRVHTGERPYKCLKCDYSARDKGCLKRHLKVHIPEKPQTDTHEYCRNIIILY